MSYLLDTCIVSKLGRIKKYPDTHLENWVVKHAKANFFISVMTIGEIQSGISKFNFKDENEKHKKRVLDDWFLQELIPRFQDRILPINFDVVLIWGKIIGENRKRGITIPTVDGLLAATAIVHNLTIVTENVNDFIETGASIFNPWKD